VSTFTFPSTFEMLTPEWMNEILRDAGYLSSSRIISFSVQKIGEDSGFIWQTCRVTPKCIRDHLDTTNRLSSLSTK
jgi:hypothetical protein